MKVIEAFSQTVYDIRIEGVGQISGNSPSRGVTITPESVHFRTAAGDRRIRQAWVYGRKINRDGKPSQQSTSVLFVGGSGYRAAVVPDYVMRLAIDHGLRWP